MNQKTKKARGLLAKPSTRPSLSEPTSAVPALPGLTYRQVCAYAGKWQTRAATRDSVLAFLTGQAGIGLDRDKAEVARSQFTAHNQPVLIGKVAAHGDENGLSLAATQFLQRLIRQAGAPVPQWLIRQIERAVEQA